MAGAALVTGASGGLGREFAKLAASEGYDVVAVARSADRLGELKRSLEARYPVAVHVCVCDLSREAAVAEVASFVADRGIEVDILVNNAGFGSCGDFVTESDWRRERDMVQVNIVALMEAMKVFMPAMVERGAGRVLNVASLAAMFPGPGMATYYASKAFVRSFSEAVAAECEGTGVSVTALCLGPAATGWAAEAGLDAEGFNRSAARPADVARDGWNAMKRGKALCYFGAVAKAGSVLERVMPRAVVRKVVRRVTRAQM